MKNLLENYKHTNISYLNHILNIINRNNFKVVIALYKEGKILDYSLLEEDWKSNNYNLRVDLELMNKMLNVGKKKPELNNIINIFKKNINQSLLEKVLN